ncbi:class I SAM-dependent methyltransferase [Nocardia transvalensis]|uniref:class I SAM-dependent methyltransferase n=1 Tax=Nocardia transvalensis TaxID=37333 RepID=UPI002B4AC96E|nr:class I SAM-dependent methyltransferase [Nocardia transvalensis]
MGCSFAATDYPGGGASGRPRRLFFAARARFAEDCVAAAGVRQVVILGAGLDTFTYRHPHPDLRVFEVDHPATQAWKRERLAATGTYRPEKVIFVPVDFETQTLATRLESAGFSRADPAVFVWLGVVFYLTPDAAHATLEYIAGQLHALGFTDIEDHSAAALVAGYLDEPAEFERQPPPALRASRILRASR